MVVNFIRRFYNNTISEDKALSRRLTLILGFTPVNLQLYKLAFYHKSGNTDKIPAYLEALGL